MPEQMVLGLCLLNTHVFIIGSVNLGKVWEKTSVAWLMIT